MRAELVICEEKHEQIVFLGEPCPLCDALEKIEELEQEVSGLTQENEALEKKAQP